MPRYTLAPTYLTGAVTGWQLNRDNRFLDCHEPFRENFDRDVEAAMDWADGIIGSRQDWQHTRADGSDHWEASVQDDRPAATGPEPTPADLRALIADASALQERIRDVERRLRASEETRHTAFRLDDATGRLTGVSEALEKTAGELARVRAVRDGSVCAVPWGVCPEHGNTLASSGGRTRCTQLACGRTWNYDRLGVPCGEPLTHKVTDVEGKSFLACKAHAMDATERLIGGTVTPLGTESGHRD
ncbi:hypothetical protein [Streptomyces sp. NPDC017529]|uniref:hypothetical protein n=1 Tax=Streptomyces sp. NPDC017529 TaxID=3365000 RepID=UPI0037AFF591